MICMVKSNRPLERTWAPGFIGTRVLFVCKVGSHRMASLTFDAGTHAAWRHGRRHNFRWACANSYLVALRSGRGRRGQAIFFAVPLPLRHFGPIHFAEAGGFSHGGQGTRHGESFQPKSRGRDRQAMWFVESHRATGNMGCATVPTPVGFGVVSGTRVLEAAVLAFSFGNGQRTRYALQKPREINPLWAWLNVCQIPLVHSCNA